MADDNQIEDGAGEQAAERASGMLPSVQDDHLLVRVQVPKPLAQRVLAERFEEQAVVGKQGMAKTILIDDRHNSGAHATAVKKSPVSEWAVHIRDGEGQAYDEALGRFDGIKGAKAAAAAHLAATVTEVGDLLEEAKRRLLKQSDILEVRVGETDRVISFNQEASDNMMICEAKQSMPAEYQAILDRYVDTIDLDDENGTILIGDHVSGYVSAERADNGKWTALGQGEVDYKRVFKATEGEEVGMQLAQDMASLEMDEQMIINHIRRSGLNEKDITYIEIDGQEHDFTQDAEPETLEVG